MKSEIQQLVIQAVARTLQDELDAAEWTTLIEDVARRERDPYNVARALQVRLGLRSSPPDTD